MSRLKEETVEALSFVAISTGVVYLDLLAFWFANPGDRASLVLVGVCAVPFLVLHFLWSRWFAKRLWDRVRRPVGNR